MSGQAPVPTDSAYSLPQMSSARRKPGDPNIVFQRTGQRTAPSSLSQFDFNTTVPRLAWRLLLITAFVSV